MRYGSILGITCTVVALATGCSSTAKRNVASENVAPDPVMTQVGTAIGNFHAVEAGKIYRGAIPGDSGIEALAKAGVRTVVDLQGGDKVLGIAVEKGESAKAIAQEEKSAQKSGLRFFSEPMISINPDVDDQTARIDEVLKIISDESNQPVFFHCRHGSDRTGLIGAFYRVFYQGCTPAQAHKEMMEYGHSKLMPWIDHYFKERVAHDSRTHMTTPAATCPLN